MQLTDGTMEYMVSLTVSIMVRVYTEQQQVEKMAHV